MSRKSFSTGIWARVRKVTKELMSSPMHAHLVNFEAIVSSLDTGRYRQPADWYRDVNEQYNFAMGRQKSQLEKDVCSQMTYRFQKKASVLNVRNTEQWGGQVQEKFQHFDGLLQDCPYQLLLDNELVKLVEQNACSFPVSVQHLEATVSNLKSIISKPQVPKPEPNISNYEDFRYVRELGNGRYAKVSLEEHIPTSKLVAVKTLLVQSTSKRQIGCFRREVSILAMHKHPCILPFFGFTIYGRDDTSELIIVTEYMKSGTLRGVLNDESSGRAPKEWNGTKKSIVALGIASGMSFLHQCKVVHRDLKSLNILLDEDLEPKIADMGLARFLYDGEIQTMKIGSHPWMAPEVIISQSYNEKADIYSYAMILYELVSLGYPFGEYHDQRSIQTLVMNRQRPTLPQDTPLALASLIRKCWAQDPRERPSFEQIVAEFRDGECLFTDTNVEYFRAFRLKTENNDVEFKIDLIIAVQNCFNEIVRTMLQSGYSNVNETDDEGRTALHIAVINGSCETLRILLDCDEIDMNTGDKYEMTAIHYAVESNNDECVRDLMVRYDMSLNAKDGRKNTPLHLAVKKHLEEIVPILASSRDCSVNAVNMDNETPLTLAVAVGSKLMVYQLLTTNQLKMEIPQHRDLLHQGIVCRNVEVTQALLQIPNINVNEKVRECSPLMLAVRSRNVGLIMAMMAAPGLDLSPKAISPVIEERIEMKDLMFLRLLLEMDQVDLNWRLPGMVPPFISAVRLNNAEAVAVFMDCPKVNVNLQDVDSGNTMLHYAVISENADMIKLIKSCPRIDPSLRNDAKQTPKMLESHRSRSHRKLLKR